MPEERIMESPATLSEMSENQGFYPEILSSEQSAESASFVIKIPSSLHFFEGHFDQLPILPGVVQVDWVFRFAKVVFKLEIPSEINLPKIKFSRPIYPDETILLELDYDERNERLRFQYKNRERICSSGTIRYSS